LFHPLYASAISLSFVPPAQTVPIGQAVSVEVVISDLGDDEVGDFDLDVSFDAAILSPVDVLFGSFLGDPDPAAFETLTSFAFLSGVVDFAEVSLLLPTDLEVLQSDSFTLATLVFDTVGGGTSLLSFTQVIVDDAFAQPLALQTSSGEVSVMSVSAVPEPGTLWLLGIGLAWVVAGRQRRKS